MYTIYETEFHISIFLDAMKKKKDPINQLQILIANYSFETVADMIRLTQTSAYKFSRLHRHNSFA